MSARIGRPPIDHPRRYAIPIRLSDPELDTIRNAAAAAGLPVGTWARQQLLTAAKRGRRKANG